MFCAKCGGQINSSLNYCNICGARVAKNDEMEEKTSPFNSLATALSFVALGGLGMLIGLMALLLNKGMTHEAVAIIAVFYLATLFGISFTITRLMSKLIDIKKLEKAESLNHVFQPVQLPAPTTAQLEEPRQPPASVTDHTTRTFDELLVKRN